MNRLKNLRISMGISMREAAKRLNMPYTTYVNYEKGLREPNSETLILLANFFGVSVDFLLNRNEKSSLTVGRKTRQSIASNLRRARSAAGYTEEAAAKAVEVEPEAIAKVESGEIDIRYGDRLLEALCELYHVTPREIIEPGDELAEKDEELKFALFGGYSGITDEMYQEVM